MSTFGENAVTLAPPRTARKSISLARPPKRFRVPDRLLGTIIPVTGVILWEILSRAGVLPLNELPAPTAIMHTIVELARSGELWRHAGVTLWRIFIGFLLGASIGTIFGALSGQVPLARRLLDPLLQSLRNIPSMAWVPLFLLWLGIQESSKIGLIALGAFFPVYLNLSSAITHIDPKLIEVGRVYRLSELQLIRRVVLPAVLPEYLVGLRSGLGLAWMFVVAAEIMGASRGLGFLMIDGQMTGRASVILASVILFATLGKTTDLILELVGRWFLRYKTL